MGALHRLLVRRAASSDPINKPSVDHAKSSSTTPSESEPASTDKTIVLGPSDHNGALEQEDSAAEADHNTAADPTSTAKNGNDTAKTVVPDRLDEKGTTGLGEDVPCGAGGNSEEGQPDNGTEEADDEIKYPGGFALAILTFGLCMAIFVVALDNTIIGEKQGAKLSHVIQY